MKKTVFLLLALAIISCAKESKTDYAIISGTIQNIENTKVTLYNLYDSEYKKELILDENGSFTDTITIQKNNAFIIGERRNLTAFHLETGDSLHINYNAKDYKNTIDVTGSASATYSYLVERKNKGTEILGKGTDIYKKEEAVYKELQQKLKKAQEDLLYNYEGLSASFIAKEKNDINYTYLANLDKYESYHAYYAKKEDFKPSEDFLKEMDNLVYNNEDDFIYSNSYRSLITSKMRLNASKITEKDSTSSDIAMLTAISKIENQTIKNKLLYDNAKYGITYTNNLEDFYTVFKANSTNEKNNAKIEESYNSLQKLAKGSASPQFKDYENYAGGTTSLNDLKGKYVYIDVWATWCGPCIAEIPSLKKVEKQFHDQDIQFLSISIDEKEDHEKWLKMIKEKELGGMQLMADNNWDSKFIQDYMIKGIPRFILLDKEGNIINANAPRPSNEELTTLLNNLNSTTIKKDFKL